MFGASPPTLSCREARLRIGEHFRNLYGPNDENMYKLAMSVLKGEHAWLEQGIAAENSEMGIREATPATRGITSSDPPKVPDREVLAGAH